jgi:hypothetical protein
LRCGLALPGNAATPRQGPQRSDAWGAARPGADEVKQPGVAFLASAFLPGAGQKYLHLDRWAPYVALETWAWISYANQRARGRELEREYRDLAWNVARRISLGPRRDSIFPYYEAMSETLESGAFDVDPTVAGVQPELDTLTVNGQQWERAKALYVRRKRSTGIGAVRQRSAILLDNAIPPGYAWSWAENRLELERFRRTIDESDRAFRHATRTLGLILANHMVSAIDALVTARLRAVAGNKLDMDSRLEPAAGSLTFTSTIRLTLGK